jgi:hypothetical protein
MLAHSANRLLFQAKVLPRSKRLPPIDIKVCGSYPSGDFGCRSRIVGVTGRRMADSNHAFLRANGHEIERGLRQNIWMARESRAAMAAHQQEQAREWLG